MRTVSLILALVPLTLGGCVVETVAKTAVDVVTLPVKAASAGVDAVTTSQKEADEKRGKQIRLAQERCAKGQPLPTDNCAAVQQR